MYGFISRKEVDAMEACPLVSVVIPYYRQLQYLAETLGDVCSQDYPRVEIILVNDGSDDDLDPLIAAYGSRIRYLEKPNGGVASARNMGVEACQGDWILFLDADDRLARKAISLMVDRAGGDPTVFVRSGYSYFVQNPEVDSYGHYAPAASRSTIDDLLDWFYPIHAHLVPRSAFFKVGGFSSRLPAAEDWDFWLRVGDAGYHVAHVSEIVSYYRKLPSGRSGHRKNMAIAQTEILHDYVMRHQSDDRFLREYGHYLLRHLYATRRKWILERSPRRDYAVIMRDIAYLHSLGCRARAPFILRIQEALPGFLGDAFEQVALLACKVLNPKLYSEL